MSATTVGLVGLGAMGRGVAMNLIAKGHELIGFDVQPAMRPWLEDRGGRFVETLAEMGARCDVVISFVVNDAQTEAVLFGEGGLVGALSENSVFVACSTMPPAYVRGLGDRLKSHGIALVDAPVTGGAVGAAKGTLTIMGAGDSSAFARVRPYLEAFGSNVHHLGETPGAGAQLKVINQLLCGVHLAAAGEALALAKRQGLPLDKTLEILRSGSASSWMLGDRGPRMVSDAFDDVTSAVDIFVKDLGLVLDAARDVRFAAPLASSAFNAFVSVSGRGLGKWDDSAVTCGYARDPYPADDTPVARDKP
ncbi:MAG: NAD(P)-dependent oxidoreductase [Burkholderiales bacterium]|jgi:putative dehydrogenase